MKNRYLSTRIMAIMMAAAMAVSAAPAAFAAERADSETIKEDNQPAHTFLRTYLIEESTDILLKDDDEVTFTPVLPSKATTFSTKQLSPPAILSVCSMVQIGRASCRERV